ncbi:nicotinate (nicotinamide) nucleotide adenylyltransferase [Sulfurimonas sp. SWIR-19]|uniref:nicotinate (nicotinamide) nucleotide adenylyltransferase n=1 Tax=Sulfurimonas sp. SWIR-19 TaxID=2878390 RepID=UPI001CF57EB7|nr:nicotinate (nicotinamide) nucleotide adenylyltransferase [Sulfurimonas sp. SWIR-19]UCN00842.1 nicotinate (nicotinamide) nucleotide adenylyltransferase [Sulfurimonas sp. SWIR-19]
MKTIALYGGSFDPPHIAHEAIVKALRKLEFIDKVVVMPTFLNPFKKTFTAPAELRLQWLKDIFASYEDVEVSAYEVKLKRKVPTITTVKHLLKCYDKVYLVIGADNLASLHQWYAYDELKKLVTFIVVTRDAVKIPKNFIQLDIDEDISSSGLRENFDSSKIPEKVRDEITQYYKEHNARQNTKHSKHTR